MASLLEVTNIKVRSLSIEYNELSWELAPTTEDVLDFTFQILRSEAPAGPWEAITEPFEDRYLFIDNRMKINQPHRFCFYMIRVTNKASRETKDFGPSSQEADPDLLALELRRHMNLLMREFAGRRCWVLPARTFGQRCPSCFNMTLKARTRSGCRQCFDSGFVRGFLNPIECWIQIDPATETKQQTNIGEVSQQNTTARLGYFPSLKPKDVIIEPENKRWRVVSVSSTQRLRAAVHQEIQIHQIPKPDIEYAIDLDLGTGRVSTCGTVLEPLLLRDLFLAGSRNFTNPQNLDAVPNDGVQDSFDLYGVVYPR
jgi:hypothetical protein